MASRATAKSLPEEQPQPPIFFFREGGSEYGFLSQWYAKDFYAQDKEIVYHTAEQYMMHQKALLFNDSVIASKIISTRDPSEQKKLGRQVRGFDNAVWEENRERIVQDGSYYKFAHAIEDEGKWALRKKLLETGDRELVEASESDRIWGIGFNEKDAEKFRKHWGLNLLGKALMVARERIREEEKGRQETGV